MERKKNTFIINKVIQLIVHQQRSLLEKIKVNYVPFDCTTMFMQVVQLKIVD